MGHPLTAEQAAIVTAVGMRPAPGVQPENLVLNAGAGAGKTSTLEAIARQYPRARMLYIAFGKPQQEEAEKRMPGNVTSRTTHALARRVVGGPYRDRIDNKQRVNSYRAAQILGLNRMSPVRLTNDLSVAPLSPSTLARIAVETVEHFCHSADAVILDRHVPQVNNVTPDMRPALVQAILPIARKAWANIQLTDKDLAASNDGGLKFKHDHYLKMWSLTRPILSQYHIILLDEAQDTNPCVMDVINRQTCQVILVGDDCQAIYGWRGAVNAMAEANGRRLDLTQSFRFGPVVAAEANKWLGLLAAPLRLRGFDKLNTTLVNGMTDPDAILCRTNAGAMAEVVNQIEAGRKVALVGKGMADDLKYLANGAADLKAGRLSSHPDLCLFPTWEEVQRYVEEDPTGADLKVFVQLIDQYGPEKLIEILDLLVSESAADVAVSTAHRAKGREWDSVLISGDFPEPEPTEKTPNPTLSREFMMLAYVTVTRAKKRLDRGGLAWVDSWIAKQGGTVAPAPRQRAGDPWAAGDTTTQPAAEPASRIDLGALGEDVRLADLVGTNPLF